MTNVHLDTRLNIVNILGYSFEIEIVAQASKYTYIHKAHNKNV